ncbi:uncharacterized protein LOC143899610 isoform X1 [Temnothorax americanus]|uniref:uncharacterized protein LOC143899610 isoform X1 n=2 Tax=Temnothorax americanus TaxID=1964332 RepID=UPI0040677375
MTEKTSKTRQGRANRQQIEALICHLERHPYMATGKFNSINGNENAQDSWNELATLLNSLAPDGKKKDVKSWKTTWRDYKSRVSEKVQKLRRLRAQTGNNPINITIDELDKRVLGIIGHDYVQGLPNVPDSFPEENNNAIEELTAGNIEILNIPPVPVVIPEITNRIETDTTVLTLEFDEDFNERIFQNEDSVLQRQPLQDITEPSESQNIPEELPPQNSFNKKSNKKNKLESGMKHNVTRLDSHYSEARKEFADIANKHADAMHILAEAVMKISEAINIMAENGERQTHLLEIILERLK